MSDADQEINEEKLARIRLLSSELESQRQFAVDREKTQSQKASFVLVAAGLVAGLTFAKIAASSFWALGLLPVAAALGAAICSTVMLVPRPLKVVSSGALINKWVDAKESPAELEDYLLESKRVEIEQRGTRQVRGATLLRTAFVLLLISIALVIVVAVINGLLPEGSRGHVSDDETPAAPAASAPQRPDVTPTMETLYATLHGSERRVLHQMSNDGTDTSSTPAERPNVDDTMKWIQESQKPSKEQRQTES